MDHRDTLDELRIRIAEGRYEVDPATVADAIIRRRSSLAAAQRAGLRQEAAARPPRLASVRRLAHRRPQGTAAPLAA